jgi:PLP dependent protein
MTIAEKLEAVRERISRACERSGRDPASVTLIAVTKRIPEESVIQALDAGLRDVGENIVQETAAKKPALAREGVRWHLVGHLQRNKARAGIDLFDIIHSVDSVRLAETLAANAMGRLQVLLQVNVAQEASKFGFSPDEAPKAIDTIRGLPNLEVLGIMTVAPAVPDPELVRPVFRRLRDIAREHGISELSMGMSDDFEVAIEEGATMVRIGQAIFGERTR